MSVVDKEIIREAYEKSMECDGIFAGPSSSSELESKKTKPKTGRKPRKQSQKLIIKVPAALLDSTFDQDEKKKEKEDGEVPMVINRKRKASGNVSASSATSRVADFCRSVLPVLTQMRDSYQNRRTDGPDIDELDRMFREGAGHMRLAYVLPLIHFLSKYNKTASFVFDKVGDFEGQIYVRTQAGMKAVNAFLKSKEAMSFSEDELNTLSKKYGKVWWKIPKSDYRWASQILKSSADGQGKCCLDSYREEEFEDRVTGESVCCLIPKLYYCRVSDGDVSPPPSSSSTSQPSDSGVDEVPSKKPKLSPNIDEKIENACDVIE